MRTLKTGQEQITGNLVEKPNGQWWVESGYGNFRLSPKEELERQTHGGDQGEVTAIVENRMVVDFWFPMPY